MIVFASGGLIQAVLPGVWQEPAETWRDGISPSIDISGEQRFLVPRDEDECMHWRCANAWDAPSILDKPAVLPFSGVFGLSPHAAPSLRA